MSIVPLIPVDSLEVVVLADNYTDMFLIQDTPVCLRPKILPPQVSRAEHGFSCMVRIRTGSDEQEILFDGSISPDCVIHNAGMLRMSLSSLNAVVISHGHPDHFLGIPRILNQLSKDVPVYVHPDAFLKRRLNNPATGPVNIPTLSEEELVAGGAVIEKTRHPRMIAENRILLTGEIERKTSYEVEFPWAEAMIHDTWQTDPFRDEQALVINVRDRGLVIISGCAHAGIINTILHAIHITGIEKIHAVIGGFHLTGPLFDPVIQPTIGDMIRMNPDYVIPMHCTGWDAITRFTSSMSDKVILNTVGTRYRFNA